MLLNVSDDQALLLHWLLPQAVLAVADRSVFPDAEALLATIDSQVRTALPNEIHRLEPAPLLVRLASHLMDELTIPASQAYQLADSILAQARSFDRTK